MLRLTSAALLLALGASRLDDVPLRFKPTDSTADALNDASRTFKVKKIQIVPFTDGRDDKKLIGRNTEDSTPKLVTTADDVGAFCATQLTTLLRQAGVPIVTENPDLVISGEVTRFMVEEEDRYRAGVSVRLTVKDPSGKVLWTGTVSGEAKRWGRSYRADNYMETLSDSLLGAYDAFFKSPDLAL